jgi:hypothetical protein
MSIESEEEKSREWPANCRKRREKERVKGDQITRRRLVPRWVS